MPMYRAFILSENSLILVRNFDQERPSLKKCDKERYANLPVLLRIAVNLPITCCTSCDCKRSFPECDLRLRTWLTLHKKCSSPFRIYSVNVKKYAGNCGFGYIY